MAQDPIHGATIRWEFEGTMEGKTFEHTFSHDGTITYRMLGGTNDTPTEALHGEIAKLSDEVWAISYLGSAGYTLSVVLDFATHRLVSFASNEKELSQQSGTFEVVGEEKTVRAKKPAAKAKHAKSIGSPHSVRGHH